MWKYVEERYRIRRRIAGPPPTKVVGEVAGVLWYVRGKCEV